MYNMHHNFSPISRMRNICNIWMTTAAHCDKALLARECRIIYSARIARLQSACRDILPVCSELEETRFSSSTSNMASVAQ